MSFDKDTRNALSKMVATCRRLLTEDVTDQLRGRFGMHPDGTILAIDRLDLAEDEKVAAESLRGLHDHFVTGEAGRTDQRKRGAYDRLVLEMAFTALNRLAALRLCEERGLVVECVRKGTASDGFRIFERVSGGALGVRHKTYRVFLECLFDELALDLGVLFDRTTPQSTVFPGERCLTDVLAELNKPDLAHLWAADETIGWIYQYFNPPEERKAMRDASQAPRNSRELAVRNQFFTPRYVVEFLTDNTLGRIWYEMRKGDTALKDECRYLVRRQSEVFLAPGEKASVSGKDDADPSQEELLKRPVHIEHRPKKDPRDLRVLDPACGSGHFLLYAFDLLKQIYEEAWEDPEPPKSEGAGRTLREGYGTLDDLRRAAPKMIIEHNLHGIDIDPRAVQIAALALWLRAQKAWKALGLKTTERPRVERSNVVTAEPMPGEEDMRREFIGSLKPRVLGQLVDVVFDKMKLAGEAGSLLKLEEEIKDAVAAAKAAYLAEQRRRRDEAGYFPGMAPPREATLFDFTDLSDQAFWDEVEWRILEALKQYAELTDNGRAIRRRLFAQDAARGFAFIDLLRSRYDVVLMNPPFGETTAATRGLLKSRYAPAKTDLAMAFVSMGLSRLAPGGLNGAITTRAFIGNDKLKKWREESLLGKRGRLVALADLGIGVLDALVEACAFVVGRAEAVTISQDSLFFSVLNSRTKAEDLRAAVSSSPPTAVVQPLTLFRRLPGQVMCYWLPLKLTQFLHKTEPLSSTNVKVLQGMQTANDFRFYRLRWEVPAVAVGRHIRWVPVAKGGEYTPFYDDIHLMADWEREAAKIKAHIVQQYPYLNGDWGWVVKNSHAYFRAGLTYPERTASDFSPRVLPKGVVFTAVGMAIQGDDRDSLLGYLAGSYTRLFKMVVDAFVGSGDSSVSGSAAKHIRAGLLNVLPHSLPEATPLAISNTVAAIRKRQFWQSQDETCAHFSRPEWLRPGASIAESVKEETRRRLADALEMIDQNREIELEQAHYVGLDCEALERALDDYGPHPSTYPASEVGDSLAVELATASDESLVARCVALHGARRQFTKKSFIADRRLELCAHILGTSPGSLTRSDGFFRGSTSHARGESGFRLTQFMLGVVLGRWDARYATGELPAPALADAFEPLAPCSPGQLQNALGLPIAKDDVESLARESGWAYPIEIPWDGVLVDDPGFSGGQPHRDDIVRRIREVLDLLWRDSAHSIEEEICGLVGVAKLLDYFRRPTGFFQDHLNRYSKSRRKAPIYWPLSTASGSYTVWLYYQRLTDQTLYAAVNKYVEPKITEVEHAAARIEKELESASGREATQLRDRLNEARTLVSELQGLRQELLRIAALPYKPNLNDGVIINAAPFHKLFRLRSWAKDTEAVWKKLEKGDYDWAHLAYTLWPDRVKEACRRDRSIAIAHGLEDLCEVSPPAGKGRGKKKGRKKREVER